MEQKQTKQTSTKQKRQEGETVKYNFRGVASSREQQSSPLNWINVTMACWPAVRLPGSAAGRCWGCAAAGRQSAASDAAAARRTSAAGTVRLCLAACVTLAEKPTNKKGKNWNDLIDFLFTPTKYTKNTFKDYFRRDLYCTITVVCNLS